MAIVNRDKDVSEQRDVVNVALDRTASGISAGIMNPVVATSSTFVLFVASRPMQLVCGAFSAYGLSSTPNYQVWVQRFAGGITTTQVGPSVAPTAFGTSGSIAWSALAAAVSYPLQAGDQLLLTSTGANTASATLQVSLVLKSLQDIKTDFGQ